MTASPLSRDPTPIVDTVLANPLAVPGGVAEWLRRWESELRQVQSRLTDAHKKLPWLAVVAEALAEVDLILGSKRLSAFWMLLKRPLSQLVEGTAARTAFDRIAGGMLERGEIALAVAPLAEAAEARLTTLERAYGVALPTRFLELVRRYRIGHGDIGRLRRPAEAKLITERITRAETELQELAALVGFAELPMERVADEHLTPLELRLAFELRTRDRNAHRQIEGTAPGERARLGQHLDQLARLSKKAASPSAASHPTIAMLEGTVSRLRHVSESVPHGWTDGPLWVGAITAANARRFEIPDRFAWAPVGIQPATVQIEGATGDPSTAPLRVMPLSGDLAYISRGVDTAIRLWSAETRLGSIVEAQVAASDIPDAQARLLSSDITMLFDGFDNRQTRWYENRRRAQLEVIARDSTGFYARIRRRGELKVLDDPAWRSETTGTGFRVLLSAANLYDAGRDHTTAQEPVEVARIGTDPVATFLGFATVEVQTGLRDNERAWLRSTTYQWQGTSVSLERETELFRRIGNDAPRIDALRRIGTARLAGSRRACPLYRVPSAFFAPDPAAFARRLTLHHRALLATFRSVAMVLRGVHHCGYALGACHLGAFAYCVDWSQYLGVPDPSVLLAHAPCATPLECTYIPPLPATPRAASRFSMLRLPVLTPMVEGQQKASAEDDMLCFGAFMLDLLLPTPIGEDASWFELMGGAGAGVRSGSFEHRALALAILDAVADGSGRRRMLEACDAMITTAPTEPSAIAALLR